MSYKEVESYYEMNDSFHDFEQTIYHTLGINNEISSRFLKRMLISTITKKSRFDIYSKKLIFLSILLYIPIVIYLLISIMLGCFQKKQNYNIDILFDGWNLNEQDNLNTFDRFYKDLLVDLKQHKLAIFKPYIFKKKDTSIALRYNLDIISNSVLLNKVASKSILKSFLINYIKIIQMSLQTGTNFFYLYSKIIYHYILYTLRVQNISRVKYFISAGDNYFDAMMYQVYKNNGVENIYLIQTAIRGENYLSSFYITCDNYFRFDDKMINGHLGLKAYKEVIGVGSLRLYNAISGIEIVKPIYDIVFIETPFWNNNILNKKDPLYAQVKSYFESLELLSKFSKKHNDLKITYRIKRNEYPKEQSLFLEKRDNILSESNIIFDDNIHKNSYEAILDSKVTIFVVTTMGLEAISIGKRVLCCNFENFDFLISQNDEIGVLIENSYIKFENKLLNLLNIEDEIIDNYFKEKRAAYGDVSVNPYSKILETIKVG